ncbi:metal homeostasis factor Atx2p [[Candida] anglica]
MAAILEVLILTAIMGGTSFLAGLLPLMVTLSAHKISIASLLSMGILVSTSLVIVIPEGIETVLDDDSSPVNTYAIGVFLLAGFLTMYLLDHLGSISVLKGYYHVFNRHSSDADLVSFSTVVSSILSSSTTTGLVIHALVDGISLGSSFIKISNFHLVIFFSIIIHKIPTCFSLTTILIKENYNFSLIKYHSAVFALTSPITAIITYLILSFGSIGARTVGYMLLYSAGTFLYVVIHVMTETSSNDTNPLPLSQESESTIYQQESMSTEEFLASIIGMSIPVIIGGLFGDH